MNRGRLVQISILLTLALAVLGMETSARLFWRDAPPDVRPLNTLQFVQAPGQAAAFTMKPNSGFYFNGVSGVINGHGLRGPEAKTPKPDGLVRVLLVGDETVFGPGLRLQDTLPRRLEEILGEQSPGMAVEVVNAGVPYYNFQRSTGLVEPLVKKYTPDLVIVVFSEDDFNLQSFHEMGRVPAAATAPAAQPQGFFPPLGNLLLPQGRKAPIRYFLARVSRGYLSAVVFFRGYLQDTSIPGPPLPGGYDANAGLRAMDLPQSSACQARTHIWTPLEKSLQHIAGLQEALGFKFAGALYSDYRLRGRAGLRLIEAFEKTGVPFLSLAAYKQSEKSELRKFSVRWGPWPNADATRRDAGELARFAIDRSLLPDADKWKRMPPDEKPYEDRLRVRENMYWSKVNEQEIVDSVEKEDFTPVIDFSKPASYRPSQRLYGWWPLENTAWLGYPHTAWMAVEASALLAPPKDVQYLHVDGRLLRPGGMSGPVDFQVLFECMPSKTTYTVSGVEFEFDIPVPHELSTYKNIEVSIRAQNVFSPSDYDLREDDDRLLSIGVNRIELK